MVARYVRDVEVVRSNRITPTESGQDIGSGRFLRLYAISN